VSPRCSAAWVAGEEVELHPDFGPAMKGFVLPDWREAVELWPACGDGVPGRPLANWDSRLTPKGPVLLELNSWGRLRAQYLTEKGILAGPLGPFLETYAFREDRKRPLFLSTTPR